MWRTSVTDENVCLQECPILGDKARRRFSRSLRQPGEIQREDSILSGFIFESYFLIVCDQFRLTFLLCTTCQHIFNCPRKYSWFWHDTIFDTCISDLHSLSLKSVNQKDSAWIISKHCKEKRGLMEQAASTRSQIFKK